jgi:putative aldouronate transport system substrate-binding protein
MKRGKSYMKKRSLALLLTTMMVTSAFAGTPAIVSAEDGDTVTFTLYNADGQEDPWTDPVAEAITEATGVKLETSYPVSSDDESVALMIAENSYPDLIFAKGDAGSLIEAGALIDLTDLIDEYGPNIKKMYGEELDKLKYSADDQAIYQLSSYNVGGESYTTSGTAQLQWDVLKENDYEIPQTLDEFETMIKDYMAAHPQTDDGYDTIGLTLSAADWHWYITLANPAGFIADGAPDNGQWLIDDDYNATYKFTSEKEREYFQWLSRMYDEGILDNSFATQTHEDYIAKISTGQVLALLDSDWDYSDAETILKADGKYGKTYAGLPLTMDEDTVCSTLMYQGLTTGYGVGISVDCEDPVKAIQFLDYLCSDEGQVLTHWGIEGVNYEIDDEGHRYRTEEEIEKSNTDSDYSKTTGVGFHTYPFPSYGDGIVDETGSTYTTTSKTSVIEEYNDEQKAACEAWGVELLTDIFPQADEFETPAYSAIWAYAKPTEFTEIESLLDEVAWPALIKCITEPVEDFDANYDAMLEELESVGLEDAQSMLTDIIKEKVSLVEE